MVESQIPNNPASGLNPWLGTFVGRQREMAELKAALDEAISGRGQLVMLSGEPGIGKTRTAQELASYAEQQGARALFGWCYEEASLSLPYLPFVEAMRDYVRSREADDLRQELGSGASDVARIVPEIRDKLQVELRTPGDPEEDRYRLLQSVCDFLINAASVRPLVLVLEDLHDADRGTLDMLTHVARNLAGAKLLIVGTYRDVEVDRSHPLSGALANLRRISNFSRVLFRGLALDEVQRMVEASAGPGAPLGLAEAVERQTEGNPLFVQEVLRYLVEEGLVSREGGRWPETGDESLTRRIPEGLRDVIGKRLSRLSPDCNRLLGAAAAIGREFRLDVLQRLTGLGEDDLYAALEEAQGAAVIEERSSVGAVVTYRFSHAFFRQTLYEEMIAPRRIRLHQQVAQALEQVHAARLEEHAAELAEHFSHSSDPSDLAKAIEYGEMASQRATSVYAYGESARLLEQAVQVQEVLDPEDKSKRCDLLLNLGESLLDSGEPQRVLDNVASAAFALAEALGDGTRTSQACYQAISAVRQRGGGPGYGTPEATIWTERADRYAKPGTVERVWADLSLALLRGAKRRPHGKRTALLHNALETARNLDDRDTLWHVAAQCIREFRTPQQCQERFGLAKEFAEKPREGVGSRYLLNALHQMADAFLSCGQRQLAEQVAGEHRALGPSTAIPDARIRSMAWEATVATIEGRLDEAVEAARGILILGEELGLPDVAGVNESIHIYGPLLYLGKADEFLASRKTPGQLGHLRDNPDMRVLSLARQGRVGEAGAMLDELVVNRPGIGTSDDGTLIHRDARFLEAAVLAAHEEAVKLLYRRLTDCAAFTTGAYGPTCVARHLGAAAAFLGEPDNARSHYQTALDVAGSMGFRPEIALTRLQLAELLLDHYPEERSEALDHLAFAVPEFREMNMQPSLERVVALQERAASQPVKAPAYPDGLSQREVEVLRLIAAGKTDREIAEELVISSRTVNNHVRSILNKTAVANRTESATYASRKGLA